MSYAAEIRSLSLFLRFKLEVIEGRKEALGKSVVCALNVKEPWLAAPHRVENDTFLFWLCPPVVACTLKNGFKLTKIRQISVYFSAGPRF